MNFLSRPGQGALLALMLRMGFMHFIVAVQQICLLTLGVYIL